MLPLAAGYLQLLSQLTKVGDYDEATFKGAGPQRTWGAGPRLAPGAKLTALRGCPAPLPAARFDEMTRLKDTYKVVVIEGGRGGMVVSIHGGPP